jgi:lantibiotic biosynthesis protein
MPTSGWKPLYRHCGVALLRAAAAPLNDAPERWPAPADTEVCRAWLHQAWSRPGFADAVRQASPFLADRIDAIRAGHSVGDKQVRRAAAAATRYLLRATGRPTPFGLFAGVAPVTIGPTARVRRGGDHQPVARADTQWLADVIARLEACPELLERLDVVFNNLATRRGGRLEAPHGPKRVSIRYTRAVQVTRDASASPVQFGALADKLTETFLETGMPTIRHLLTGLVEQGFLITCLRAPLTVTDPLAYLVGRLSETGAATLSPVTSLLRDLAAIDAGIDRHNLDTTDAGRGSARAATSRRMRQISPAGRTPLAVDLLLDCDVQLPDHVVCEMERAASALLRLTRQPAGDAAWRDFHAVFCDRYGTGTLVPVTEVVDPDAGLGYPAGYPGSVLPRPADSLLDRDEQLLALAWQAVRDGSEEIALTEETIRSLTDADRFDERHIPPHVELSARVHATSVQALDSGEYTLTVAPARAAGTLTSRFTPTASGSGLEALYRDLPTATEGALPVQMSFPPVYPQAENICRVPAYLPHLLSLGEHRSWEAEAASGAVDDLAITATRDRLHLVSMARRRVVEPQVYHALALEKQPPPLARFLACLPRAFSARWHEFDWGPHAQRLPYLPRVRYRRTVISPARWRLTTGDLPTSKAGQDRWQQALDQWRHRWHCPGTAELRDADRTLRLTLTDPAHAAVLRAHLQRHGHARLTETASAAEFGWLGGHVHEVAVPLVTTRSAAPSPLSGCLPQVTNAAHGHLPGSPDTAWLYTKIYTHPERHDEIISEHLRRLLAVLDDDPRYWFVRYRSQGETDHLRPRIRTPGREHYAAYAAAVGEWAQQLRHDGIAGRLVFDTYWPETGRYGHGTAMEAAEAVFAADSRAVCSGLRHLPNTRIHPTALVAVNMVDIVSGFLGSLADTVEWLAGRPASAARAADQATADHVIRYVRTGALGDLPGWPDEVSETWQARAAALAEYRVRLAADMDTDAVLESLLHMHHNRAIGIDPDGEKTCRRLARQAAFALRAQQAGTGR